MDKSSGSKNQNCNYFSWWIIDAVLEFQPMIFCQYGLTLSGWQRGYFLTNSRYCKQYPIRFCFTLRLTKCSVRKYYDRDIFFCDSVIAYFIFLISIYSLIWRPSFTHGMTLKLASNILLDKRWWLMTWSFWSRDSHVFYRLETNFADVGKNWKITSSTNFFFRGLIGENFELIISRSWDMNVVVVFPNKSWYVNSDHSRKWTVFTGHVSGPL